MSGPTPSQTKLALVATIVVVAVATAFFVAERTTVVTAGYTAPFLWLFSALFLARVAGQLVARSRKAAWLPPTDEWNLSPYTLLLPAQLVILAVMAWVDISFSLGRGLPVRPNHSVGSGLLVFAYVYAGVMAARYGARMVRRPEQRWFGGAIPIVFHFVLASYVYVFASFHASH